MVCLKSLTHFRAWFENTADAIVTADTPSNYPSDLKKLAYKALRRPIYPLDPETRWECT